jgi:hypothetical protein
MLVCDLVNIFYKYIQLGMISKKAIGPIDANLCSKLYSWSKSYAISSKNSG